MNEKKNKMSENVTSKEIAGGSATPIRKFSAYVSERTVKVIPVDGPNAGKPEYQTVITDSRVPQLIGQLQSANTEIDRLKAELQRYQALGKVPDTMYDTYPDENPVDGVYVYRNKLRNEDFDEICREIYYLEKVCRALTPKRIGKDFMNEMVVFFSQECFGISREEAIAKGSRSGDAVDSVTAGIRVIRNLVGDFENVIAQNDHKFSRLGEYAAKIRQLASSMNLENPNIFFVCFNGEILTDSRIYRDLLSNQMFSDKLSRFQLSLHFAVELLFDYPLLYAKPAEYLIDFMTSVLTENDIAAVVRRFRDGIPVTDTSTVHRNEKPLDDQSCNVLEFCLANGADGVSAKAMMNHIKEDSKSRFQKTTLKLLRDRRYLEFACADANSSRQRYRITPAGMTALRQARPGRTYSVPSRTDSEAEPTAPSAKRSDPNLAGTANPAGRNSMI